MEISKKQKICTCIDASPILQNIIKLFSKSGQKLHSFNSFHNCTKKLWFNIQQAEPQNFSIISQLMTKFYLRLFKDFPIRLIINLRFDLDLPSSTSGEKPAPVGLQFVTQSFTS